MGWPRKCVDRFENTPAPYVYVLPGRFLHSASQSVIKSAVGYHFCSDALIGLCRWSHFRSLKPHSRRCQQWWQVSLSPSRLRHPGSRGLHCFEVTALWGW